MSLVYAEDRIFLNCLRENLSYWAIFWVLFLYLFFETGQLVNSPQVIWHEFRKFWAQIRY